MRLFPSNRDACKSASEAGSALDVGSAVLLAEGIERDDGGLAGLDAAEALRLPLRLPPELPPAAGGAGSSAAAAAADSGGGSNFSPKLACGSTKPLMARNGTSRRSGTPLKERPTSKAASVTARSQNWCCRTTVISVGILRLEAGGDAHARMLGVEGDEEVVLAGHAGLRHLGKHLAHEAAQGVLGKHVVTDEIFGHRRERSAAGRALATKGEKWRLLLPGASEPRLDRANGPGLESKPSGCITQRDEPQHSCRWQLF